MAHNADAPAAYFISEFCAAHRLSPSMYFKLKSVGKAPAEMQVGRRRMVSVEAAEAWRREREVLNDWTETAGPGLRDH